MKKLYLAGGCFWGVEAYLGRLEGVQETSVGYANGHTKNPTYEEVCRKNTGYAEAVYVLYDESVISLSELLQRYFRIIDPTSLDRQGPDVGNQYRTGIYYVDPEDEAVILDALQKLASNYSDPIRVEVQALKNYYRAEEYHQKYLEKNPRGYCHVDLSLAENPL